MPYLKRDKKNHNHLINCTLIKQIGEGDHDYEVEEGLIKAGLDYLKSLK